jgi:hypothetical protein
MMNMSQHITPVERLSPVVVKQTDSNHLFSHCATRKWAVLLTSTTRWTSCSQATSIGLNQNTQIVCLAIPRCDGNSRHLADMCWSRRALSLWLTVVGGGPIAALFSGPRSLHHRTVLSSTFQQISTATLLLV